MAKGLFLVGREMFDHPVVGLKKPQWFAAWVWMIGEARWKSGEVDIAGKTVILKRGQLSCSLRFMSKRLGMTIKGLRVFIKRLEKDTLIVTDKGTGQTVITICNYDTYQDYENYRAQLRAQIGAEEGHSKGTGGAQTITPEGTPEVTPDIPPKKKGTRKIQIPDDWKPNEKAQQIAKDEGYSQDELNLIADNFINSAHSKGTVYVQWHSAFYKWLKSTYTRDDIQRGRQSNGKTYATPEEFDAAFDRDQSGGMESFDAPSGGPIIDHDPTGHEKH